MSVSARSGDTEFEDRSLIGPFACPVCGEQLALMGDVGQSACRNCGFVVSAHGGIPILVSDVDAVQRSIDEAARGARASWYEDPQDVQLRGPYRHHVRKRIALVRDVIQRYAPAEGFDVGLDTGCGDGENLVWLSDQVRELYASDYNLQRLGRAASKGHADRVVMADLTAYPAKDEAFDLVFCNHVLEHVPQIDRALGELHRILSRDGILIIGVPNEGAAFWRLAYRLAPETRRNTDHVHFFTAASLSSVCARNGFEVLEVLPIGWGLPHWKLDSRVRAWKPVDDILEFVGRRVIPGQATSLYLVLSK